MINNGGGGGGDRPSTPKKAKSKEPAAPAEAPIDEAPEPVAPPPSPDDGSDWLSVGRHLVGLTDEQRDVVLLRVIAGLSAKETGDVVDKSPEAVRQLQRRGLRALERQLHADGSDLLER